MNHRYITNPRCPFIGLNLLTLVLLIILNQLTINAKPYKSHRCLDWNFGGWSPLYSLQPSVSPPIYHRPKINHRQTAELHRLSKSSTSANYVKKLKSPSHQNWLPFYQQQQSNKYIIDDNNEAKVIRYNVRTHPSLKYSSKSNLYPKYPQYLPTTVLHLKKVLPKKAIHENKMMNIYSVPIKPYSIQNIYKNPQPIIYEQLNYHLSNQHFSHPKNNGNNIYGRLLTNNKLQMPRQKFKPQQNHYTISNKVTNKPKKTTIAAYIPVVQVPAIETAHNQHVQQKNNYHNLPVLDVKKPISENKEKVIEEHIYQIPNHMLHEVKHEVNLPKSLNNYQDYSSPIVKQVLEMPPKQHMISQPISHIEQSYGQPQLPQTTYIEISKPQILYEVNDNNNNNYNNGYKLQTNGPPIHEMPYQMDNYAKAEDAGLFKPLLDQTRQNNNYPKIGVVPYKNNDPENLNVIHLIANQKHLPMVVPIASIHTSNDGNYPIGSNEVPVMEKEISSYSERPMDYQKQSQYQLINNIPTPQNVVVEQEKIGYLEDEKVTLQTLQNDKSLIEQNENIGTYKEEQIPQYVVHQTYSPVSSLPEIPVPLPPVSEPETNQYQTPVQSTPQVIEQIPQIKVTKENDYSQQQTKENDYPQQQIKENNYQITQQQEYSPIQQQEIKSNNDYTRTDEIKEQPITQIQQITTEYIRHEEPKAQVQIHQKTNNYINQPEHSEVVQKDNYSNNNYKINEGLSEYGKRMPATNYQYIKPNNLQQFNYNQNGQTEYNYNNEQSTYIQQQVDNQKTNQHATVSQEKYDEQANIAAYEEAKKSILKPISYTTVYQQPDQNLYESQALNLNYQQSYQPPLSTGNYKLSNDYTDDYSNNYDSRNNFKSKNQPITENKASEEMKIVDKVYDLPSNTAEKVVINTNSDNNYLKEEILRSEEQTKKNNYETIPQTRTEFSEQLDDQPIKESLKKSENGNAKYGERLVYVKSKKFRNLKMVNGNTYLGDTLLYSASTPTNYTTSERIIGIKNTDSSQEDKEKSSSILTDSSVDTINYDISNLKNSSIQEMNSANSTKNEDEKIINYIKPVSRSFLRNLIVQKSNDSNKSEEQIDSSASEHIESKLIPSASLIDLDNLKSEDDLNVEESQLFHAYYGPADHQAPEGYVRLTVEQFKNFFKDAEIHVLDEDLRTNSTPIMNSPKLDDFNLSNSTSPSTAQS